MRLAQGSEEQADTSHSATQWGIAISHLLAAIPYAAAIFDIDQQVVEANQSFLDLLGLPQGPTSETTFPDLVADPGAHRLKEFIVSGATKSTENLRLRTEPDCTLNAVVCLSRLAAIDSANASVLALVIESRAPEPGSTPLALAGPASSPIDQAQAFARVATWMLDLVTGRIHASQVWYDIWGFDQDEEVTFDRVLRHLPPKDRDEISTAVRETRESGVPFRIRHRIIRPDGSLRWAETAGRVDPASPEPVLRLSGVVLDITQRHEAEEALARYYDIVSASPDRIAFLDRGCRLQAANAAFLMAVQGTRDTVIGRPLQDVGASGALVELIYRNLGRCLDEGDPVVDDIHETDPAGQIHEHEVRLFPHRDDQDRVTGIVINVRDVTSVRESERRLLQSAAIYAETSDGVLITDATGRIVAANDAFSQMTGYAEAEVLGRKPSLLNSQWHSNTFFIGIWRRLLKQGAWQGEIWNRRKDGEILLHSLSIRRILDSRGKAANFVAVFAERRAAAIGHQSPGYLALYDPLTKLPNRVLFESRLAHAVDPTRRNRTPVALFLLDLDRFANINSSLGHPIGDELLRAVGLRLRETIRPADTIARLSGNQFGLLFEGVRTPSEAEEIAQRLRCALRAPMPVRGYQLFVTMSMGIALDSSSGNDVELMYTHAESALRIVKQGGRDGFRIHSDRPADATTERERLIGLLRAGLDKGEYRLYFQPRVELETGRWAGAEAVVRWHQPELGMMPPERFLPLADSTGMMVDLGQWVLAEACRQFQDWRSRELPIPSLTVNISEAQLTRFDLVPAVERLLRATGLEARRLELEFNESLLFRHPERAREVFNGLHRLGVGLTLSEVGMSWLAPPMLRRLPIGRLKIHRCFIETMPDSKDDLAVVQALVAMAQALDIDILADGVHDDRQRMLLLNMGCLEAQGALFTPPLAPLLFERHLLETSERGPLVDRP
jgi:diguanylate cyclase (GGDEF)-like protein/PAS domain S-box-containing protein